MKKYIKITKKDYKYFVKRCRYWIKKLHGNHIEWYFRRSKNDSDAFARYNYSKSGANVVIRWLTDKIKLDEDETKKSFLDAVAFHEIAEILLFGKLRILILDQRYNMKELDEITHESLNRLSTLLGINHGIKLKSSKF